MNKENPYVPSHEEWNNAIENMSDEQKEMSEKEKDARAQEIINGLPEYLMAIADKYLKKGNPPNIALEQARAQETIDGLPDELKVVADKYLGFGGPPKGALMEARAQEIINGLPKKSKAVADEYLGKGCPPSLALKQTGEDK